MMVDFKMRQDLFLSIFKKRSTSSNVRDTTLVFNTPYFACNSAVMDYEAV